MTYNDLGFQGEGSQVVMWNVHLLPLLCGGSHVLTRLSWKEARFGCCF